MRNLILALVTGLLAVTTGGILLAENPSELQQELAAARAATAKYQVVDAAIADGYRLVTQYVPGVGLVYLKDALLGDGFDLTAPEGLLYVPEADGVLRLVGVEYRLESLVEPSGFTGNEDNWRPFGHGSWVLHVWLWLPSSEGIFSETNPNLP